MDIRETAQLFRRNQEGFQGKRRYYDKGCRCPRGRSISVRNLAGTACCGSAHIYFRTSYRKEIYGNQGGCGSG